MGCCRSKSQKKCEKARNDPEDFKTPPSKLIGFGKEPMTPKARMSIAIKIITDVQQHCPSYLGDSLEKAVEILQTIKFSSLEISDRSETDDDPTDVLGTLLHQNTKPIISTEGSSNEEQGKLERLLETASNWDFDVILLAEITDNRPLVWAGMTIFSKFRVAEFLKTDDVTLRNWLTLIEANYHPSHPFHNSTHAADVLQATAYFLSKKRLKEFLGPLDAIGSLIAAICHDVDHPGKTSQYLTNVGSPLSILYNDSSILESHHAAFAFKLSLSDPRVNIFKNLNVETYKEIRKIIIDMIFATDMSKHFEHLSNFASAFQPILSKGVPDSQTRPQPTTDISSLLTPQNKILVKRMLIKCADISNPTRPIKLCVTWANRISEEYFQQTEDENGRGLSPTMAMFDRKTCSMPKSQYGFMEFCISSMFTLWDGFLDIPEVVDHMKFNYKFWKELDHKGIQSVDEVMEYLRDTKSPHP